VSSAFVAGVGASLHGFGDFGFFEVFEEVIFFSEVVDVFALPMRRGEGAVVFAGFGDYDSAVFNG
jgi:hypothetical protein